MSEVEIYESMWKVAQRVHQTPFVPKSMMGKPEHVLACVLYGNELGLGPMQALNSIHVIEGRAAASPELMRALVAKAGHRIDVTENTNEACTMKGSRVDTGAEATVRWSLEDAKNAGLQGKDNWRKYPRAMLVARATSELCRLLFPDVIAGLSYTPEEVESFSSVTTVTPLQNEKLDSPAPTPSDDIVDAVIIETDIVPPTVSPEPEEHSPSAASGSDAVQMVLDAFPGSEVVDAELVDSKTIEQRRAEMKRWGNWNKIRAIAMPIARGEGLPVPENIDDFVHQHTLYTLVAKQFNHG